MLKSSLCNYNDAYILASGTITIIGAEAGDNANQLDVNQYLDFLIDTSFQGVNRLFVLLFENDGDRKVHTGYYLPNEEE